MLIRAFVALAIVLSGSPAAAGEAGVDDRFNTFLEKFVSDAGFRAGRIVDPLPAKIGNVRVGEVKSERWSRSEARSKMKPLLPAAELAAQGLSQRVKKVSGSRVEVTQFRPGASDHMLIYRFQKLRGAWQLTHVEDTSMPPPTPAPPHG